MEQVRYRFKEENANQIESVEEKEIDGIMMLGLGLGLGVRG